MRILILEDEQLMRKALAFHLLEEGHMVSVATNGEEALRIIETDRAMDVILCDVMTPVMSGPSFILSLRKFYPQKRPVIVIITSVKEGEQFLKEIEIPYDYYIGKPVDFGRLSAIMREIASGAAEKN